MMDEDVIFIFRHVVSFGRRSIVFNTGKLTTVIKISKGQTALFNNFQPIYM